MNPIVVPLLCGNHHSTGTTSLVLAFLDGYRSHQPWPCFSLAGSRVIYPWLLRCRRPRALSYIYYERHPPLPLVVHQHIHYFSFHFSDLFFHQLIHYFSFQFSDLFFRQLIRYTDYGRKVSLRCLCDSIHSFSCVYGRRPQTK